MRERFTSRPHTREVLFDECGMLYRRFDGRYVLAELALATVAWAIAALIDASYFPPVRLSAGKSPDCAWNE